MNLKLSLEERVDRAHRQLALVHAACQADEESVFIDRDIVVQAISEAVLDVARLLEPLKAAPGPVANWEPAESNGGAR